MMYNDVHERRMELVYSKYTADNQDFEPIKGYEHIGRFEKKYGYPTEIDKVWEDRDRLQNSG